MKKIILFLLFISFTTIVHAKTALECLENGEEYTNKNGVTINTENYSKMKDFFDDDEIENMNIHLYKNISESSEILAKEMKYLEVKSLNIGNKSMLIDQHEITKEEYQNKSKVNVVNDSNSLTTDYKSILLMVSKQSSGYYRFGLYNEWLKMPKYRSFDILALRWEGNVTLKEDSITGFQDFVSNGVSGTVDYPYNSNNYEIFPKKGVGLSQNLVNDSTYYYQGIYMLAKCSGTIDLYGTYQHAQSDITEEESKNYTISGGGGMGNVLFFGTQSLYSIYDNTPGLKIEFNA